MSNPPPPKNWTIRDLLAWATRDFAGRGLETPRLDAELLLAEAMPCKRVDLYLRFEEGPAEPVLARFREAVRRRRNREPVAYIVGRKAFHELELAVGPGIFVPRPETELLVDEAITRLKSLHPSGIKILDLGTGSGAIALALLHALPALTAWAVDRDPRAGQAALANAQALGLQDRFLYREGDLFAPVMDQAPFDLITCNPPYVPTGEIPNLMPEVKDHEPRLALDGGPDGLDLVRRVLREAPEFLKPGGWLLFEVGEGQAQTVAELAGPLLSHEATRDDLRGIPRIVILRKK